MRAIFAKARFDLRTRLRSLVALALILGVGGGIVLTALAGASRTDTVYERFLQAHPLVNVGLPNHGALGAFQFKRSDVAGLPGVAQAISAKWLESSVRNPFTGFSYSDNTWTSSFKLIEGRFPDPERADEVIITPLAVRRLRLRLGSEFPWIPNELLVARMRSVGINVPELRMRIVGIAVSGGSLGTSTGAHPTFYGTPALDRSLPAAPPWPYSVFVRLKNGTAGLDAFRSELDRLAGGKTYVSVLPDDTIRQAQRSFHFQASALRLLGILAGLALVLVFSQTLSRQAALLSEDVSTLSALGMTGRQLRASVAFVMGAVGAAGGIVAAVVGFALSPLAPFGDARLVEVTPGAAFDAAVLALGALAIAAGTIALSLPTAWRAVRRSRRDAPRERESSRVLDTFQRLGMSITAVAGARLAFDRRARPAVPVRGTIAEIALGVAGVTLALAFSASMSKFLTTPGLAGKFWDVKLGVGADADTRPYTRQILAQPGVRGLAFGLQGGTFVINGISLKGQSISPAVFGDVGLPVLEGRRPRGDQEIALGSETMRLLRVRIGDRVVAGIGKGPVNPMTVVGRVVLEPRRADNGLGVGVLATYEGEKRLFPGLKPPQAFIRLDSHTTPDEFLEGLGRAVPGVPLFPGRFFPPSEAVNLGNVSHLPLVLAGILGVFALATLLHALVSVIRARSRDFAILKALGFDRRQVARTVAWQASLIVYVGLLFGVPAGIVAGRALWLAMANSIGVVPQAHLSALPLVAIVPAALLAARLIAAIPGRAAARTSPALVLRAE